MQLLRLGLDLDIKHKKQQKNIKYNLYAPYYLRIKTLFLLFFCCCILFRFLFLKNNYSSFKNIIVILKKQLLVGLLVQCIGAAAIKAVGANLAFGQTNGLNQLLDGIKFQRCEP